MPQWKDTRRAGVVLLAVVLMGAAPPMAEEPAAEVPAPAVTRCDVFAPKRETMLSNHVFVAPRAGNSLLVGDLLVYPPNVSAACEHRGPQVEDGERREHVQADLFSVVDLFDPPYELGGFWWGFSGPMHRWMLGGEWSKHRCTSLPAGKFWDVIAPGNPLSELRPVPDGVVFLYTGEVGPGCKLMASPKAAPALKAVPEGVSGDGKRAALYLVMTLDELLADQERARAESKAREEEQAEWWKNHRFSGFHR